MIKLIIISGRSGSGKSTALHVLEDMGFYCIDNLPLELLQPLANNLVTNRITDRISVGIDARNFASDLEKFPDFLAQVDRKHIDPQIVYLDCSGSILVKRYSETRRKHPLTNPDRDLREALDYEKDLLTPISGLADLTIDTTSLTIHQLRDLIRSRVAQKNFGFSLLFESFAFRKGVPIDADLVFDARCLPNPHWKPELRALNGTDDLVQDFLENQADFTRMFEDITTYLETWLPKFEANNRSYMTIAIGCTGGQHRSVYMCEKLQRHFQLKWEDVLLRHREIAGIAGNKSNQVPGNATDPGT
jgi:UPF0042 nucleotide-binding protein